MVCRKQTKQALTSGQTRQGGIKSYNCKGHRQRQARRQTEVRGGSCCKASRQTGTQTQVSNTFVPCMSSFHWACPICPLLSWPDCQSFITTSLALSRSAVEHLQQSSRHFVFIGIRMQKSRGSCQSILSYTFYFSMASSTF